MINASAWTNCQPICKSLIYCMYFIQLQMLIQLASCYRRERISLQSYFYYNAFIHVNCKVNDNQHSNYKLIFTKPTNPAAYTQGPMTTHVWSHVGRVQAV